MNIFIVVLYLITPIYLINIILPGLKAIANPTVKDIIYMQSSLKIV